MYVNVFLFGTLHKIKLGRLPVLNRFSVTNEYPVSVLRHYLDDAGISIILATESMRSLAQALVDDVANDPASSADASSSSSSSVDAATTKCIPRCLVFSDTESRDSTTTAALCGDKPKCLQTLDEEEHGHLLARNYFRHKRALIIYTSGSTGPPKGVVLTHGNLCAQMDNMIECWRWTDEDLLLHVLPLHHVHGIVNCLYTPLQVSVGRRKPSRTIEFINRLSLFFAYNPFATHISQVGATIHILPHFDAEKILYHLTTPLASVSGRDFAHHSLFMAVPTIYVKLLRHAASQIPTSDLSALREMLSTRVRLMVSGSAALPTPVFDDWFHLSGAMLLLMLFLLLLL